MNYIKFQVDPMGNLEIKFEIDNAISNSESQLKENIDKGSNIKRKYFSF